MLGARMLMAGGLTGITISASVRSPDIAALAAAAGWRGGQILLRVNAGVDVAGLVIPATIPNDCLTLINRGRIGGMINGGKGLQTTNRITVDNAGGTIQGSGGQGGSGGTIRIGGTEGYSALGSPGNGGNGAGFSTSSAITLLAPTAGSAGTTMQLGGPTIGGGNGSSTGGRGGNGGAIGAAGLSGSAASITQYYTSSTIITNGGAGGAAGAAVDGDSKVTWIALGTITGSRIN
ncbi:hypothetical protein [Diaphorobacter caeni]|uniref:hypothetical protein n=1 Tax=Diaphorobacter caeni TaxID=2784387 RepID=UPI00188E25D6|nr:hypothetical protein [Diaphorobacter caeni]MBF5006015.1 hypothetical protein [Diaphorobacter caeni]